MHRLILKVIKFQFSLPKCLGTVVKNIMAPSCQIGLRYVDQCIISVFSQLKLVTLQGYCIFGIDLQVAALPL